METKTRKQRLSRQRLDEIAGEDGFKFLKVLGGYGSYHLYTDGKFLRTYDPKTGKTIGNDYIPKGKINVNFNNPTEIPAPSQMKRYLGSGKSLSEN